MKTTHVIFLGVACMTWASCARNGEPGPDAVVVRVLDTPLPPGEWGRSNFLWDGFANKPHVEQFHIYTAEKWKETYSAFAAALVKKAEKRGLDASSLRKALDLILASSGDKMAYLPVGAFQTTMDSRLVWIVAVNWEHSFTVAVHRAGATTVEAVTLAQHAVAQRIKESTNREVDNCRVPTFDDSLIRWG